ncbi:DinB family protein [Flavobacterium selenitireducens]|uniref:DinB family protein n=1 Tax=Flavobacterium selenitireducens TaxID=2722704 RepID=UPI00168AF664|nr:DinB family protein [Flavobacterium selenitireducens]MBD3581036.1 damage-inducible protein DinB [Flavobacterium selenitireducens]
MPTSFSTSILEELRMEIPSTRKCLERIDESVFRFKPHERSMEMGYLAILVAQIPLWIAYMIDDSEIDFKTFPQPTITNNEELMAFFEENLKRAEQSLTNATEEKLSGNFTLKNDGHELYSAPKKQDIVTTLNHWVHHRGQLTVYMRMNDIPVPSIYGPSADDRNF